MAIFNSATLKTLNTSLKAIFNKAFEGVETKWQKIAMRVPSNKASNTYGWLGQLTRFREWIGDRVIQNLSAHEHTIKNKKFENTVAVKRDDIEDDDIGIYYPIVSNLAYDTKTHPDELVFGLLNAGKSTKCYDGQNFFDTDHPVLKNGKDTSVSNYFAGSGKPWFLVDDSRPVKPIIFQERKATKDSAVKGMNEHEKEFLPAVLEVTEMPPSHAARLLTYLIMFMFTVLLLWSIIGKIDIIATSQGKLIPASNIKTIQTLTDSEIEEIYVQEGQYVKAGDDLIKFNQTEVQANIDRVKNEMEAFGKLS